MIKIQKTVMVAMAVHLLFFSASCAPTTKLTRVWKDDTYKGGFLRSIMVVDLSKNTLRGKMLEDAFVKQFKRKGVRATASGAQVSSNTALDVDTIRAEAQRLKMEAIFVTHFVSVKDKAVFIHPSIPPAPGEKSFASYYSSAQYSGRDVEETDVGMKSNLYETSTEKLIWSVSSESIDANTVDELVESLAKVVLKNLRQDKLIQ
jgi:hypothetical protein